MGQGLKAAVRESEVGTFLSALLIADSREAALRAARAEARRRGYRVVDVAQVTPQSHDEWYVDLHVRAVA